MKKRYILCWGIDSRHLVNVKSFNLLREAKEIIPKIEKNYMGSDSAYRLERHQYKNDTLNTVDNIKVLKEVVR